MIGVLAVNGVAIGVFCGAVIIATVLIWRVTAPRGLAYGTLAPVLRRGMFWWFGGTLAFAILGGAWVVLREPLGLPRHGVFRYVPLALGLMPLLVINPLYLWRTAWLRRALAASQGRLCTHCGYSVAGLPPTGTCPECGKPYNVAADAPRWQSFAPPRASAGSTAAEGTASEDVSGDNETGR